MLVGRTEPRGSVNFTARLHSLGDPPHLDPVSIKNISSHGARVVIRRPLPVHVRVVLESAAGDLHVAAEVIYCERLGGDRCAVGLRFPHGVDAD